MEMEDYLKRNKAYLDTQQGDYGSVWNQILQKKQRAAKRRRLYIQWAAASVILFFAIGMLVRHEWVMQQQLTSLSQINKELARRELQYQKQVSQKWEQYTLIQSPTSPMEALLIDELKRLDTLYQKGLGDLKEAGFNERVVVILLDTYEKRLRIIEQLIYEKQKQVNYESKTKKIDI
ncbi:MAG: hypothetical protein A2W95_18635 [Bacteroidetes bacterium GWA2_40_14]|jgi:hypothetical protein|nr:MAG: hypothetical protein A2W95_18635 [Bacteroidetes bacterium GWA2_40_14]